MIQPSPSRVRPFEKLAQNDDDMAMLLQAESDAPSVLLNDWTHDVSERIYRRYNQTGAFPFCVDSLLANGHGRVECLPDCILEAGTGLGIDPLTSEGSGASPLSTGTSPMGASMGTTMTMTGMAKRMDMGGSSMSADMPMMDMSTTNSPMQMTSTSPMSDMVSSWSMAPMTSVAPTSSMTLMSGGAAMSTMGSMSGMGSMSNGSGMGSFNAQGCTAPIMFNPGYNVSSLPPSTCINTMLSLLNIPANCTQGWLALNLVNSGASPN